MRRGVGVAAVQNRQQLAARAAAAADTLAVDRAKHVAEQLASFRTHLEAFAAKHRHDINRDPEFRRAFQKMSQSIGVDPLASSKGFWGELLGLGDFYYELSVQAVEVCLATRGSNGGLLSLSALRDRLQALRQHTGQSVSEDDVRTALRKLECLGGGYRLVTVGRALFVCSVPAELSLDHTMVIQCSEGGATPGAVTVPDLCARLCWDAARAAAACKRLTLDGLAWVDDQSGGAHRVYWVPAVWQHGGAL